MSGKIDDPVGAEFDAFPEEPNDLGGKFADVALSLGGLVFLPIAIGKIIADQFDNTNRANRINHLLNILYTAVKGLESQLGSDREKMKEVKARIDSPRFEEAIATACEESARAADVKRIERMAEVLTGSLTPTRWSPKDEDVATLIRDLVQLGDRDIQVLETLSLAFGSLMITDPSLPDPRFTDNNSALDNIVRKEADKDEFFSTCGRLIGFGLGVEVTWPRNHTQPHERCIRPTRRGLALLGYLKKFAS
jgi:hypothetical protein